MIKHLRLPQLSWRFIPVWQRNYLVWRKLAIPSILGNLADPMLYMLGLGYGLGSLLPDVGGMPYLTFLAAGTVAYSTMNAATFEVLYSSFSRMHVQRTWDAIMNAPMTLDDVMLGELTWAVSKSLLSGLAILAVIWGLGLYGHFWMTLWIIPVVALVGFCFGGLGLVMNAVSPSYDFFLYY
ncbi:MAG: nodulation protein NodJ, partial [Betaproteobacteria bacterium]|nr:nodulation protein NodJ [Betaproteobacteria bacterium]